MKGQSYVILGIIVFIIVSIFAVLNVASVEVNYLFWTGTSPLIFVILFSVLMGGIITATVGSVKIIHLQREVKRLRKESIRKDELLIEHGLVDPEIEVEQDQKKHH